MYSQKKIQNYKYYNKIIDSNVLNSNNILIKPYIIEGTVLSNKLEIDISNIHINFSYTIYQRIMSFVMNIIDKISNIMVNKIKTIFI